MSLLKTEGGFADDFDVVVGVGLGKDDDAAGGDEELLGVGYQVQGQRGEETALVDDQQLHHVVAVEHVEIAQGVVGCQIDEGMADVASVGYVFAG